MFDCRSSIYLVIPIDTSIVNHQIVDRR